MKQLTKKAGVDKAKWVWAIGEQLYLLDSFDADYIDEAAGGWESHYAYETFRKNYRLTRGKLGLFLKENPESVLSVCNEYFAPKLGKGIDQAEIMARWHGAAEALASHTNNEVGIVPYSFAMKLFWCFHPKKLTMYDRYTRAALGNRYGVTITPDNYLEHFYDFYKSEAKAKIKEAMDYHSRVYPYKYRIADKYLWLEGSNKTEEEKDQTAWTIISSHRKAAMKLK